MNIVNAKNKELMSRNVKLEWEATAAEEQRQSQLLDLSGRGNVAPSDSLARMGLEGNTVAEDAAQRENVIFFLRTEIEAFQTKICTIQVWPFIAVCVIIFPLTVSGKELC